MADETAAFGKASFASSFASLRPAILDEWSEIDEQALGGVAA